MGHPTMQENDTAKLTPTRGAFIAHHNTLFDWRAAIDDLGLASLFVDALLLLCLHRATSFLLDHFGNIIIVLLQGHTFDSWAYP